MNVIYHNFSGCRSGVGHSAHTSWYDVVAAQATAAPDRLLLLNRGSTLTIGFDVLRR